MIKPSDISISTEENILGINITRARLLLGYDHCSHPSQCPVENAERYSREVVWNNVYGRDIEKQLYELERTVMPLIMYGHDSAAEAFRRFREMLEFKEDAT